MKLSMKAARLCLWLPLLAAFAPSPVKIYSGRVAAADMDNRGRVYFIDSAYQLCKYENGAVTGRFSLTNYGEEALIDASNPVEIFVFYRNSGFVLITDNQLNPVREINLFESNNLSPGGFGRANDGNIWLLDDNTATLKKFDRSGRMIQESLMLGQALNSGRSVTPVYDNGAHIALTMPDSSTVLLNPNLSVVRTWPANQGKIIEIADGKLFFSQDHCLVYQNTDRGAGRLKTTDTVACFGQDQEALTMHAGRILLKSAQGLFLQPR